MVKRVLLWKSMKRLRQISVSVLSVRVFSARRLTWIGIWLLSATAKRSMWKRTGELTAEWNMDPVNKIRSFLGFEEAAFLLTAPVLLFFPRG